MGKKLLVRCSQLNLTFNQVECSGKQTEWPKEQHGPLAQLAEQRTFNPRVAGSSPARPTRKASNNVLGQNNPPHSLLIDFPRRYFIIIDKDDAGETLPRADLLLALRETIVTPSNAGEAPLSFTASSTPPEYAVEVIP